MADVTLTLHEHCQLSPIKLQRVSVVITGMLSIPVAFGIRFTKITWHIRQSLRTKFA